MGGSDLGWWREASGRDAEDKGAGAGGDQGGAAPAD
jgi:hypothetical protein